jgi:hypothetical protein
MCASARSVPSRLDHRPDSCRRIFDSGIPVLVCSSLHGKHPTTMNVFEVAIGKFVSPFGILGVTIVNSEMPFCIFAESMHADKLILFVY